MAEAPRMGLPVHPQAVENAMQDKANSGTRPQTVQPSPWARPLASSPCGLDHIETSPWEYGPEFLSTLDRTFAVPAGTPAGVPAGGCDAAASTPACPAAEQPDGPI